MENMDTDLRVERVKRVILKVSPLPNVVRKDLLYLKTIVSKKLKI